MTGIVELSTGHVFAKGSIKSVGPLRDPNYQPFFEVYGVGFKVRIEAESPSGSFNYHALEMNTQHWRRIRQEAIENLLNNGREIPQ